MTLLSNIVHAAIKFAEKKVDFVSDSLADTLVSSTAPAAGGPGNGTRQTGDHGGAKCFDRGTWAPPSAS